MRAQNFFRARFVEARRQCPAPGAGVAESQVIVDRNDVRFKVRSIADAFTQVEDEPLARIVRRRASMPADIDADENADNDGKRTT